MAKKSFTVFWTQSAQFDFWEIINYIKNDSEINAEKIFLKIRQKASELCQMPEKGRIVPEFREYNINQYREIIVSPWRIIYKIEGQKVYILSVLDGRRDTEELLFRKVIQYADE